MNAPEPLHLDVELGDDGGLYLPSKLLRPAGFERGMDIRIYVEDEADYALRYLGFENSASIQAWEIAKKGLSGRKSVSVRVELDPEGDDSNEFDDDETLDTLPRKSDE